MAVKVLRADLVTQENFVSHFLRESRILKALDDPRLVGIIDFVAEGSLLAIVMEFVQGQDLGKWLDQHGPLGLESAVRILEEVLEGLAVVHRAGIVHGDLKPANLMMPDDSTPLVRIADFGIARVIEGASSTETVSQVIGSPPYMAPELIQGSSPSRASDLYALGVLAHELLTGRPPFDGGNTMSVLFRHVHEEPARPDGLSDAMWQWLSQLLAKGPSARPSSAETALALLRSATADSVATVTLCGSEASPHAPHDHIKNDARGGGGEGKTVVLPPMPAQTKVLAVGTGEGSGRPSGDGPGGPARTRPSQGSAADAHAAGQPRRRWAAAPMALMALVIIVQSVLLAAALLRPEERAQPYTSPGAPRSSDMRTPMRTSPLPTAVRRTAGALPDVTGMHVSSAQDTLTSYGYTVQLRERIDDNRGDGEVIGQEPGPGGSAADGAVLLTISRQSETIWLSELDAIRGQATPTRVDLDDRTYSQGVALEPACSAADGVSYSLGRRFSKMTAVLGAVGEPNRDARIRYSIQIDGREVQSGTLSAATRQPVQVNLEGGGVLRVESTRDSDGCGLARLVLGDPRLVGIPA